MTRPRNQRPGRPPAGARVGEKVTDYPQLSIRVPPDVKRRLQVIVQVTSRPQWHVIADAIESYQRELPSSERRRVEELLAHPQGRR
jgi:hypothetical protein